MRHHLSHQTIVRAVSITFLALLLGLGMLAPNATADVLSPSVDDGGSGGSGGSDFVPMNQNQLSIMLIESREPQAQVVITGEQRRIQLIEGKLPDDVFAEGGDEEDAYCFKCYSYR